MLDPRTDQYAAQLARMIRVETVSTPGQSDKSIFYQFHDLLRDLFPTVFSVCTYEDFDGSFLLRWQGRGEGQPILFMNHHDVVEAPGQWTHPPFAGEIADGKLWGRDTLDTKGGLWAMLQAAEELIRRLCSRPGSLFSFCLYGRDRRFRCRPDFCRVAAPGHPF